MSVRLHVLCVLLLLPACSLDGKRLYITNSLLSPWDKQFYPDMVTKVCGVQGCRGGQSQVQRYGMMAAVHGCSVRTCFCV
jgi:hypothetical protein